MTETDEPEYGYCNACGEEALLSDDCCEDGEVVPYFDDGDETGAGEEAS